MCEVSLLYVKRKGIVVRKRYKVWSPNLTLTFDVLIPKSIEVLFGSWSTYVLSIIILCQKVMIMRKRCKLQSINLTLTFDVLTQKSKEVLPPVKSNTCVKYHHCMSKGSGVIVWKPLFHRQTDGWTERQPWWNQYTTPPPTHTHTHTSNFLDGGYKYRWRTKRKICRQADQMITTWFLPAYMEGRLYNEPQTKSGFDAHDIKIIYLKLDSVTIFISS